MDENAKETLVVEIPEDKKKKEESKKKVVPTEKQKEFLKTVSDSLSLSKPRNIYKTKPYDMMKQKGIKQLMNEPKVGLDDRHLLDGLKKALRAKRYIWSRHEERFLEEIDWATQIKALEIAFKLKGYLGATKGSEDDDGSGKQITVNFNLVKARDPNEVKKLLSGTPAIEGRDVVIENLKKIEVSPDEPREEF